MVPDLVASGPQTDGLRPGHRGSMTDTMTDTMSDVVDLVADVMSAPVTVVRDHDSAWHALVRFTETGLRHLVVLDDADRLVGVLEDRRVLALWPLEPVALHRETVGRLVRSLRSDLPGTPQVHYSAAVPVAAGIMLQFAVDGLPVVDDHGRVVGIVTGSDMVRSLARAAMTAAGTDRDHLDGHDSEGTRQTATVPPSGPA
jgi:CBS domain-containing protein